MVHVMRGEGRMPFPLDHAAHLFFGSGEDLDGMSSYRFLKGSMCLFDD